MDVKTKRIDTAIIVAGGLGTRLRPLTEKTPKPLLPIRGKPIIEHTIINLRKHGVKKIILSVGYKAEKIKDYFKDGSKLGVKITYSIEEQQLGTGGATKKAAAKLRKPFFLIWGDNLSDVNFSKLQEKFAKNKTPAIMTLTPREDVEHFGVAKLKGGKIVSFVEKPRREEASSNLINAGVFIIGPVCLKILPKGKSSLERDCFEKLSPKGKVSAYLHGGQWFPTDTSEKYNYANFKFRTDINLEEKKIIIADVDDTICKSCQLVSNKMAKQISNMIKQGYQFAFISGTKNEDLMKMLSSRIKEKHHLLATTGTNYTVVENNVAQKVYNLSFTKEEKKEIIRAFEKLIAHYKLKPITTKEDQLQDRGSQITLSAIGRHAPSKLKAKCDPNGEKRKVWVEFLKKYLDKNKYDLKIGGTTSIDVTRKRLDKEWGIRKFAQHYNIPLDSILFFGDKLHPGGNDFPATKIVDCIAVDSPTDTLRHLRRIAECYAHN